MIEEARGISPRFLFNSFGDGNCSGFKNPVWSNCHLAMKCKYCDHLLIKKGIRNNIQKYYCRVCKKYSQSFYKNKHYSSTDENNITGLCKEGVGIASISRFLQIPKTTVIRKIKLIASRIKKPALFENKESYDIDEIKTMIRSSQNECWVTYCINHKTGKIIDFITGRRTMENVEPLINCIKSLNPKRIYTDGLNIYPSLIGSPLHKVGKYLTWKIERNHLTIRDRLKRLSRETLCFSKSELMLICCLKIFFWGKYSKI
jgi:IS1 family transposase/transposase-like protein